MKHSILHYILKVLSLFLRLIAPPKCSICSELLEGSGELCPRCLEYFTRALNRRCPICSKTARSCTCRPRNLFYTTAIGKKNLLSLTYFPKPNCKDRGDIAARRLVYAVKKSYARSSARFAARQLSLELLKLFAKEKLDITEWVITYPPRSRVEKTKYGFDQSRDLARLISQYTGMKVVNCFNRKGNEMQKNLSAAERKFNADNTYFLKKNVDVSNRSFIIVDDVVTTGSTVNACAALLMNGGASNVFPISIARQKRKKLIPQKSSKKQLWFKK